MLERVRKTITRYNMLPRGGSVAVAVSGGPDSVCLLHVLAELAPSWNVSLAVAHLNHQLRGAESDEDEHFVAQLAASLGLQFHRASVDVAASDDNLEQAGRRARRSFFAGLKMDRIALGHTRDDQAETVLFRLLRGSGLRGLAGIYPVTGGGYIRPSYIRPLIDVTRAEVEEFLRARGIAWREDASNLDPRFARNRIRRSLLPQLARDWNPRIGESLAHLASLAHDEERWWRSYIDDLSAGILVPRSGGIEVQARRPLADLPPAVSRRLIRRAITQVKGNNCARASTIIGHCRASSWSWPREPRATAACAFPASDIRRSGWIRIALASTRPGLDLPTTPPGHPRGLSCRSPAARVFIWRSRRSL